MSNEDLWQRRALAGMDGFFFEGFEDSERQNRSEKHTLTILKETENFGGFWHALLGTQGGHC